MFAWKRLNLYGQYHCDEGQTNYGNLPGFQPKIQGLPNLGVGPQTVEQVAL